MSLSSIQVRVGGGVVAWELAPMIGAYHYGCSTREKKKDRCLVRFANSSQLYELYVDFPAFRNDALSISCCID